MRKPASAGMRKFRVSYYGSHLPPSQKGTRRAARPRRATAPGETGRAGGYMALEWAMGYAGMMIAPPASEWEAFGPMPGPELAGHLREWGGQDRPGEDPEGAAPKADKDGYPTDKGQGPTCFHGPVTRRGEEDSSGESQQASVSLTP